MGRVTFLFGSAFPSEGVASWLGGSFGKPPDALFAELLTFQRRNPTVSLSQLLGDAPKHLAEYEVRMLRNATGALAVHEVNRQRQLAELRALRHVPAMAAEDWLRRQLNLSFSDSAALDRWWRDAAMRVAGDGG